MQEWIRKAPPYLFAVGIFGALGNFSPTTIEQQTALGISVILLFASSIILIIDKLNTCKTKVTE